MEKNEQKLELYEDEIDLAEIMRKIWAGRITIFITTVIFITIAVMYLLYGFYIRTREYESQATLLIESPSVDSLITVVKSPLFLSEVLKMKLTGLTTGSSHSVLEVLAQQTKPPQGNLTALTDRVNCNKGNQGILTVTVMMQNERIATQLADSIIRRLTQFLIETQVKRAEKNQLNLAKDTLRNFNLQREVSLRNLKYISKGTSNNIQFLIITSAKNIQLLTQGTSENIKLLTEGLFKAESVYMQSQKALADFYARNSNNLKSIDSLEVKRLSSEIKLKFNVYSDLYQQLEQAKIYAKNQFEQAKLEVENQLDLAKIDSERQLDSARINAEKKLDQIKSDAKNQIEKVKLDLDKQTPVITILEPATPAIQVGALKAKIILIAMLFFGFIAGIGVVYGKNIYVKNFGLRTGRNSPIVENSDEASK